jgi:hypothetical protein
MQTTTQTQSYSIDAVLAAAGSATPADAAVAAALSQHNLKGARPTPKTLNPEP